MFSKTKYLAANHLLVAAAFLIFIQSATAASLDTDAACYVQDPITGASEKVQVTGTGFTPSATYAISLSSDEFGSGTVGNDGTLFGSFYPPSMLNSRRTEKNFTLSVNDGITTASTHFRAAILDATYSPSRGNPRKTRVKFRGSGFGEGSTVYLHYITPKNKRKKTIKLGRTTGPCGKLKPTRKRKMFPFKPALGNWIFRFSTSRSGKKTGTYLDIKVQVYRISKSSLNIHTLSTDNNDQLRWVTNQ